LGLTMNVGHLPSDPGTVERAEVRYLYPAPHADDL
jgi:hypothetical protein